MILSGGINTNANGARVLAAMRDYKYEIFQCFLLVTPNILMSDE